MNCPPDVAAVVVQILKTGVLRARERAWSGDADGAATEADHVHNLPDLLAAYSEAAMRYYWEVERPSFVQSERTGDVAWFQPLWDRLETLLTVPNGRA